MRICVCIVTIANVHVQKHTTGYLAWIETLAPPSRTFTWHIPVDIVNNHIA